MYAVFVNNEVCPNSYSFDGHPCSSRSPNQPIKLILTHMSLFTMFTIAITCYESFCAAINVSNARGCTPLLGQLKPAVFWRNQMLQIFTFRELCKIHHWCKNVPKIQNYSKFKWQIELYHSRDSLDYLQRIK